MNIDKNRIVTLLPIKANSERVVGKNFRDFCGKPLFYWILDALLEVKKIDQIIINTDARDILSEHGLTDSDRITIRDRKPEICGDFISMNQVLADDISNVDADIYLMTHTTNPLLSAITIQHALQAFQEAQNIAEADSLFTVNKIQSRFYHADGSAVNHDPNKLIRTQDLEPWYEENSNLYIFTRNSFSNTNSRIGLQPMMFEGSHFEAIDIDDEDDWNFAVVAARHVLEQKRTQLK